MIRNMSALSIAVISIGASLSYSVADGGEGDEHTNRNLRVVMLRDQLPLRWLLHCDLIREEVMLSCGQASEIEAIGRHWLARSHRLRDVHFLLQKDSKDRSVQKVIQELSIAMRDHGRQADNACAATLTDMQKDRVFEISLQLAGPRAFLDPDIRREVGVTPEQEAVLVVRFVELEKSLAAMFALYQKDKKPIQESNARAEEIKADTLKSIVRGFTDEQRSRLARLAGTEIEFNRLDLIARISHKVEDDTGSKQLLAPIPEPASPNGDDGSGR